MDMLRNREPMKLDENGCNMVRVLYRLELIKEIFWEIREWYCRNPNGRQPGLECCVEKEV